MEKKIKDLESATGPIQYSLTNDYMFRSVFQESKEALKGLLCAVLHLREDEIKEIEICNPVELGKNIESKDFILDLKITFNNYILPSQLRQEMSQLKKIDKFFFSG